MTSAYANKLLKQLNEEKAYWETIENERCAYVVANGEEPVVPDYDFRKVSETISGINKKIVRIKHAINCNNVNTLLELEGGDAVTIDQALVIMAQLNKRKQRLDAMRSREPKTRNLSTFSRKELIEYTYINYDIEDVRAEYDEVSARIMDIQIKLDHMNQTAEFEVDI